MGTSGINERPRKTIGNKEVTVKIPAIACALVCFFAAPACWSAIVVYFHRSRNVPQRNEL